MMKKKTMWCVIQDRVDNNPDLRRAYMKFIIDKSKLIREKVWLK